MTAPNIQTRQQQSQTLQQACKAAPSSQHRQLTSKSARDCSATPWAAGPGATPGSLVTRKVGALRERYPAKAGSRHQTHHKAAGLHQPCWEAWEVADMERGVRRREDSRLEVRPLVSTLGVEAATARLSLPCRAAGTTADRPHQDEPAATSRVGSCASGHALSGVEGREVAALRAMVQAPQVQQRQAAGCLMHHALPIIACKLHALHCIWIAACGL